MKALHPRSGIYLAFAAAAATLLPACTTPTSVAPGATVAQATAQLGKPAAIYDLPDGGKRYFYTGGGLQQQAWMLDFDRDGRLLSTRQVHSEESFAQVRVGKDTQDSVTRLLGPPAWTENYAASKTTAWFYPHYAAVGGHMVMTVIFDANGTVQAMQGGPDKRAGSGGAR